MKTEHFKRLSKWLKRLQVHRQQWPQSVNLVAKAFSALPSPSPSTLRPSLARPRPDLIQWLLMLAFHAVVLTM